jgi:festuclavine dehydrogenase
VELEELLKGFGMPEDYSRMMSAMDTAIKHGAEERTNDAVLALTGKKPRAFREWAEASKGVWP